MLPLLALLPPLVEAGIGAGQLLSARANKKRAVLPASVDSRMNAYDSELNNMRAGLSTGSAYKDFIDSLNKERANTTAEAMHHTGGYYGLSGDVAAGINESTGNSLAKLGEQSLGDREAYDQLHGNVQKNMSDRSYNLDMTKYAQNEADYKENKQAGFSNLFGAVEDLAGIKIPQKTNGAEEGLLKSWEEKTTDPAATSADDFSQNLFDNSLQGGIRDMIPQNTPFANQFMRKKKLLF